MSTEFEAAFIAALPNLYKSHTCSIVNIYEIGKPVTLLVNFCEQVTNPKATCSCAVDQHNKTLDVLADMLKISFEDRHRLPAAKG